MVFFGFVTSWSFATPPTRRSPFSESATTVGRIRFPRSVGTTFGIRLRTYATHAFVVPRSIPMMGFSRGGGIDPSLARGRRCRREGHGATVIETLVTAELRTPSVARYVNASGPTYGPDAVVNGTYVKPPSGASTSTP